MLAVPERPQPSPAAGQRGDPYVPFDVSPRPCAAPYSACLAMPPASESLNLSSLLRQSMSGLDLISVYHSAIHSLFGRAYRVRPRR